jgi:hypothetical protein
VAENHRPPRAEEVKIPISIRVKQIGALGMGYERRIPPYRTKRANRRVNATGKKFFSTKLQLAGTNESAGHIYPV